MTAAVQRSGALFAALTLLACASGHGVDRRRDGTIERGREVPTLGYAWYARAVYLREQGREDLARVAFERARRADPESGAAWAGEASSYCRTEPAKAERQFRRGLRRATEQVPIRLARARCALVWRRPAAALRDAEQALAADPSRAESAELMATALELTGQSERARWLRQSARLYAGAEGPSSPANSKNPGASLLETIDQALRADDLLRARRLAQDAIASDELAVRALAVEKPELARAQAELSAPDSPSALLVLGLLNSPTATSPLTRAHTIPMLTDLATCVLAAAVSTRVGSAAGARVLSAAASGQPDALMRRWRGASDPLLRSCSGRLAIHLTT